MELHENVVGQVWCCKSTPGWIGTKGVPASLIDMFNLNSLPDTHSRPCGYDMSPYVSASLAYFKKI